MITTTLPVFCRLRAAPLNSPPRIGPPLCSGIDDWLDQPKQQRRSKICEAFREAAARDWISQIVHSWEMDQFPLAVLSEHLGTSISQGSRLVNDSSTSIGVLGQWAAAHRSPFLIPDHYRWSMNGLAGALQATIWLHETTATRPNRTPLGPKISDDELAVLVVLEALRLQVHWDTLTDRFESDLYQAIDDIALSYFLQRFAIGYQRLTQQYPPMKRRCSVYFPQGKLTDDSRWLLCRDIDNLIRKIGCYGSIAWSAVDGLTPWLMGIASVENDDDEAA